jgi:hypothetical protein
MGIATTSGQPATASCRASGSARLGWDGDGSLLSGEGVANAVHFIVTQPPHAHISDVVIRPTRQDHPCRRRKSPRRTRLAARPGGPPPERPRRLGEPARSPRDRPRAERIAILERVEPLALRHGEAPAAGCAQGTPAAAPAPLAPARRLRRGPDLLERRLAQVADARRERQACTSPSGNTARKLKAAPQPAPVHPPERGRPAAASARLSKPSLSASRRSCAAASVQRAAKLSHAAGDTPSRAAPRPARASRLNAKRPQRPRSASARGSASPTLAAVSVSITWPRTPISRRRSRKAMVRAKLPSPRTASWVASRPSRLTCQTRGRRIATTASTRSRGAGFPRMQRESPRAAAARQTARNSGWRSGSPPVKVTCPGMSRRPQKATRSSRIRSAAASPSAGRGSTS